MKHKFLNILRSIFLIKPLEKFLVKLTIGKEYETFITKVPPCHFQYSTNSKRKAKRNGIWYYLYLNDLINWYIYYGFKEKSKQNLYSFINKNDIILDIGANIGEISMNAAKIVGENGKVFGFEPDKLNFSRFNDNLKLNTFSNIEPINKGFGDKKGIFLLSVLDSKNRGMNRIVNTESGIFSKIEVIKIDDFVKENKLNKIDLIKIDVEGYEMKVLIGGEQMISEFHPIIFVELNDCNLKQYNSSAKELITFIESKNYIITNAKDGTIINSKFDFINCHFDIICK